MSTRRKRDSFSLLPSVSAAHRATEASPSPPLPVERVTLSGRFERLEESASALFRLLLAEGRVVGMHESVDYGGRTMGHPELRRAPDGLLFPVKAIVEYERNGARYRIDLDKGIGEHELTVKIHGPVGCLETMERFIEACGAPRASVVRGDLSARAAADAYERIRRMATNVRLLPEGLREACRIRLDEENRLQPERLRFEATIDGHAYQVRLASTCGAYELSMECGAEDYARAAALVARLVAEVTEPESASHRAGHVRSTGWEASVTGYSWSSVGGLGDVAEKLREWVELPLRNPRGFELLGIRPPKGVLLCGPPGTGKTTLGKVLANESRAAFFAISPGDIASMWYGETEHNIARLFARLRQCAKGGRGAILFVDEMDGFFQSRDKDPHEATRRALAQVMTEMDGFVEAKGVIVIGATNRPADLDPALRRPGRFDFHVEIPLPDEPARREILGVHLRNKPCAPTVDVDDLARRSDGMSGADIELWCGTAAFHAWKRRAASLRRDPADLSAEDLQAVRIEPEDFAATTPRAPTACTSPR